MPRSFSDDEVARILARAAELQSDQETRTTGLAEIEQAAAEAGIDPALVRAAAVELDGGPSASSTTGPARAGAFGPSRITLQTSVDGEIGADDFARLNDVFQQAIGVPATVSHLGSSVQWSYVQPQMGRSLQASVSVRDGRSVIRLHEGLFGLMGAIYGGVGGGVGASAVIPGMAVGGFFLLDPAGAVAGALVGTALSFAGTRALFVALARRREAQLQRAFEALAEAVRDAARPSSTSSTSSDAASTLADARARQGLTDAPGDDVGRLASITSTSSAEAPVLVDDEASRVARTRRS